MVIFFMYYLSSFFIYSILGFCLETIVAFMTRSHFKSGILYGPWTPVYGIGSIMIMLLSHYLFYNLHMPRIYETIFAFVIITILLTAIEWLGGVGIEYFFHKTFWDYSDSPWAIGKYISLSMSLLWGIGSIIFIYVIEPFLKPMIERIPFSFTIIALILFVTDFLVTVKYNAQ